jgi:hypothetical protein
MRCELTDEEDAALARLVSDTINDDRYLLLARIRLLKSILGRIRPERSSPPLPRRSAREIHRAYKKLCCVRWIMEIAVASSQLAMSAALAVLGDTGRR